MDRPREATMSVAIPVHQPDLGQLQTLVDSVSSDPIVLEIVLSDATPTTAEAVATGRLVLPSKARVVDGSVGMVANWNAAWQACIGDLVVLPGQDDLFADNALSAAALFADERQLDLILLDEQYVDGAGHTGTHPSRAAIRRLDLGTRPSMPLQDVLWLGLVYGNVFGDPCAVVLRRSALLELDGFSDAFPHAADLELWLRAATHGFRMGRTTAAVAYRRIHADNLTKEHVRHGTAGRDRLRLHETFAPLLTDRYARNRSAARLWAHHVVDGLRSRTLDLRPPARFERGLRIRAVCDEVLALANITKPRFPST